MALNKPNEYHEIEAQQNEKVIYAEDINQIIVNTEKLKGGAADEKPVSSIKELNQKIDALEKRIETLENQNTPSADNTQNLLDTYNLELRLNEDIGANNDKKFNAVLEKKEDKYILKGSIRTKIKNTDQTYFTFTKMNDNENLGIIFAHLAQFIEAGKAFTSLENQITVKEKDVSHILFNKGIIYKLGLLYGMPIFFMQFESALPAGEKEYDINFNIEINKADIKNMKDYILYNFNGEKYSYLKLEKNKDKTLLKGSISVGDTNSIECGLLASDKIIENYFNIQNDKNDAHFKITEGISSSNGKKIKYYIKKENTDMSVISPLLKESSLYSFYIKYEDGSKLGNNTVLTLNLQTDK